MSDKLEHYFQISEVVRFGLECLYVSGRKFTSSDYIVTGVEREVQAEAIAL